MTNIHAETPDKRVARIMTEYKFKSDFERRFAAEMVKLISVAVLEEREANARIADEISGYAAGKIRARTTCETDTSQQGSPG